MICLCDMEKGYVIMNHGVKFVECDKNKQMEGILEIPIKEPLEAMIKTEYIDCTFESNIEDIVGDIDDGKSEHILLLNLHLKSIYLFQAYKLICLGIF